MRSLWMTATAVFALAMVAGCVTSIDPQTGQKTVALDPNVAGIVEPIAAAAGGIAPLFGPIGAAIGGVLLGALGAWRKVKPNLTQARVEAEYYHAATAAVVEGLEEFKKLSPDAWKGVGDMIDKQLARQGIDAKIIENVIRAVRGLPARG